MAETRDDSPQDLAAEALQLTVAKGLDAGCQFIEATGNPVIVASAYGAFAQALYRRNKDCDRCVTHFTIKGLLWRGDYPVPSHFGIGCRLRATRRRHLRQRSMVTRGSSEFRNNTKCLRVLSRNQPSNRSATANEWSPSSSTVARRNGVCRERRDSARLDRPGVPWSKILHLACLASAACK